MVAITISLGTGGALIFRKCVPLTCVNGRLRENGLTWMQGSPVAIFWLMIGSEARELFQNDVSV
jgi:hypothetical protein